VHIAPGRFILEKTIRYLNQRGQISIFFATTVLILITFIAFIVNIGIFVKAKINLQNAVDASAYAGASVQARQLTNIAYLNWEMRNVYKEWMYKSYILGNLNLEDVVSGASGTTNLMMADYSSGTTAVQDNYNIPSACVDFQASGNVTSCAKAMVPGLPGFQSTAVMGLEETMDTFMDAVGGEKAKDCAVRTNINYLTAFTWAYNIPESGATVTDNAPEVLLDRPGAYPRALELAFRIRALEAQVNKKPYDQGYCLDQGVGCSGGNINGLVGGEPSPSNERIYKAFYSGFRNLGAQDCGGDSGDEFKCFYTLTELAPTVPSSLGNDFSLSNILIPSGPARDKYYLDLKMMTVNYASFFTMLAPNTVAIGDPGYYEIDGVAANSTIECVSTKVGIPVPGYPMGFVKSPDVMTYYAVKAQTRFIGRFSPFANNSLTLTAYAAAKPFGGRIGPMLFDANVQGAEALRPRTNDSGMNKSSPYLSALNSSTMVDRFGGSYDVSAGYAAGVPIPLGTGSERFFVISESDVIGGNNAVAPLEIYFSIPNMVYDFPTNDPSQFTEYSSDNEAIEIINPNSPLDVKAGLYNAQMFNKLRSNLTNVGAANITVQDLSNSVLKARSPTLYEAHHYLVPTPEVVNKQNEVDSYGYITKEVGVIEGRRMHELNLYAPLISTVPDALYKSVPDLRNIAKDYLENQEQAILKYRGSMNQAAWLISDNNRSLSTGSDIGLDASQLISSFDKSLLQSATKDTIKSAAPGCDSVTGGFVYFFIGTGISGNDAVKPTGCDPQNRLINMLETRWQSLDGNDKIYYREMYLEPEDENVSRALFSGYRPGPMNDANDQGVFKNAVNSSSMNMWRNSYSTKFVTLKSLSNNDENHYQSSNFTIFSEGNMTKGIANSIDPQVNFANYLSLPPQSDFSKISH